MIKRSVKTCILIILQIPVLLMELLIAYLGLLKAKCECKAVECINSRLRRELTVNAQAPAAVEHGPDERDRTAAIEKIMRLWDDSHNCTIASDRMYLEKTETGQRVIRTNPDRHLYSVAKPTRPENLKRIENVLREMDELTFDGVLQAAQKMFDTG